MAGIRLLLAAVLADGDLLIILPFSGIRATNKRSVMMTMTMIVEHFTFVDELRESFNLIVNHNLPPDDEHHRLNIV